MSLEGVKTVNADCTTEYLEKITDYKNLTKYNETREHEKVIGKCFPLPVKLNLPTLSLEEENTSGVEWLAPALVGLGVVGLGTFFCYYFYNAYFKKNGNQQASTNNLVKEEKKQVVTQTTSIIQEESLYKILKKINNKLKNDDGLAEDNKILMQSIVANVITEVSKLTNESDIKKITTSVKDLLNGRITKTKLKDIKEDVDYLIKQQSKLGYDVTVNKVEEIIYDKPLLNHTKLLQAAVDSKLSSDLIYDAINNNDDELILAGLISVGHDVTATN